MKGNEDIERESLQDDLGTLFLIIFNYRKNYRKNYKKIYRKIYKKIYRKKKIFFSMKKIDFFGQNAVVCKIGTEIIGF